MLPALFLTFGSAPAVNNISTISSLFAATAKCNGVRPRAWHFSLRSKPESIRSFARGRCPREQAQCRAVRLSFGSRARRSSKCWKRYAVRRFARRKCARSLCVKSWAIWRRSSFGRSKSDILVLVFLSRWHGEEGGWDRVEGGYFVWRGGPGVTLIL